MEGILTQRTLTLHTLLSHLLYRESGNKGLSRKVHKVRFVLLSLEKDIYDGFWSSLVKLIPHHLKNMEIQIQSLLLTPSLDACKI